MRQLLRKHLVIFLTICLMQTCQGQHLDQKSLEELARRDSELHGSRFPECMRDDDRVTLWCDKSRYQSISDITTGEDTKEESIALIASEIQVLWINDSRLQTLNPGDLAIFDQLTTFVAENNFLTTLKTRTFTTNPRLEAIDLSRNKIKPIEDGAFEGLTQLLLLDLGLNSIGAISWRMFRDLTSLEYLSLQRNQIQVIPRRAFISSKKLKTLTLIGNKISQIHRYGFDELSVLEELDLSNNKIRVIQPKTFYPLRRLRKLYLRGNQIKTYPYDLKVYTINLEVLDLGANHLQNFGNKTFSALKQLSVLKIDHNSLTRIDETIFHENENLELLNISANALEDISANAFSSTRNLSTLLLQSNHLQTPKVEWFVHLRSLPDGGEEVNLSENDWWCDCTTKAFEKFMIEANGGNPNFSRQLDIHCSSNLEYVGQLSELDIFCPLDSSNPPTNSKPTIQTTPRPKIPSSVKPVLLGIILDLPMITNANDDVAIEKSSMTSNKTSAVSTTKSSTSKTLQGPLILALSNTPNASGSTGNISVPIVAIVATCLIIASVVIGGLVFLRKKSNRYGLRKIRISSRRKRHSSSQPFLDGIKVSLYGRELSDPFSDDEDVTFTKSGAHVQDKAKQSDTFLSVEEEKFYTPRTTPRPTPKMPNHGASDDAQLTYT